MFQGDVALANLITCCSVLLLQNKELEWKACFLVAWKLVLLLPKVVTKRFWGGKASRHELPQVISFSGARHKSVEQKEGDFVLLSHSCGQLESLHFHGPSHRAA